MEETLLEILANLRESIGLSIKEIRKRKKLTQEEFIQDLGSRRQLGIYEGGKKSMPLEELLVLLNERNISTEEFFYLMDNEHISIREILSLDLSWNIARRNLDGLKKIKKKALNLYETQGTVFFLHTAAMAQANITLLNTNNDYEAARKEITSVKEYLLTSNSFFFYDLILLSQCLFLFEIKDALSLVKKGVTTLDEHYDFYKHKLVGTALILNLAIYALDFPEYLRYSLEYSKKAEQSSIDQNSLAGSVLSQIIYQVACFKIGNGLYDYGRLVELLEIYKTCGWLTDYEQNKVFIEKHGIRL
ncbi:MAG: hypothetical protein FWF59_12490 [Turicibacter sp.]|nr:hypothetical protein [Turicibacter sp.]